MALFALDSSHSVNRLLTHPDPVLKLQIKTLGSGDARLLLEYQAARQSRWYFEVWALAQIVLGGVFFFFMLFATGEGKVSLLLALFLFAEVLGQQVLLVPGLLSLGRLAGEGPVFSGEAARTLADGGYWAVEILKLATALALGFRLIRQRHAPSGHARKKLDLVDEANHRHVNG
jgi:hypothetical protein